MVDVQYNLFGEEIKLYDRCRICGRPLKSLRSRMLGVGPVCEQKLREMGVRSIVSKVEE